MITIAKMPKSYESIVLKFAPAGTVFFSTKTKLNLGSLATHFGCKIEIQSGVFTNIEEKVPVARYLKKVTIIERKNKSNDTKPTEN